MFSRIRHETCRKQDRRIIDKTHGNNEKNLAYFRRFVYVCI